MQRSGFLCIYNAVPLSPLAAPKTFLSPRKEPPPQPRRPLPFLVQVKIFLKMLNVVNVFTQDVFCLLLFLNFESLFRKPLSIPRYREKSPVSSSTYSVSTLRPVTHEEPGSVYRVTCGSRLVFVHACQQSHLFRTFLTDSVSWALGSTGRCHTAPPGSHARGHTGLPPLSPS